MNQDRTVNAGKIGALLSYFKDNEKPGKFIIV